MRSSLAAFVVRRAIAAVLLVAVVGVGAFTLVDTAKDDALTDILIQMGGRKQWEQERRDAGLDQPYLIQLARWSLNLAHFDLGRSLEYKLPVGDLAAQRAANTARLAAAALLVALVGWPIGVLTGARPRGFLSRLVTPVSVALVSCPPIIGTLGLLLLGVATHWISTSVGSLTVPALALGLPLAATIERLQARAMADALASPDLAAAAARGVPGRRLLWKHAARQSLGPILGVAGVLLGGLFSGSLGVEAVSGWPGLGRLMLNALQYRDVNLVAGCALIGAAILAFANFVTDIARALVDRRTVVA